MNGNAELLNFVFKNSQMGVVTLKLIMELCEDEELNEHLKKQYKGYKDIYKTAKVLLDENGVVPQGITKFEKCRTRFMIKMKTMQDKSKSNIAQMLILGSNMGIIDAVKKQHQYKDAEKDILKLMKKLQDFEEDNVVRLECFL